MTTQISDGLLAIVKRDCPTCELVAPVLGAIKEREPDFRVVSQDDPEFPNSVNDVVDDRELKVSYDLNIEIVPTLIRFRDGIEIERAEGWHRPEWQVLTGLSELGETLPESRPGCGSLTTEPGMPEQLGLKYGDVKLKARAVEISGYEDDIEACFDRGWSDGLPVVPPTPERVYRMVQASGRAADQIVGKIPPDYADCSIEKIAINAVMAGCKPEYLPTVIAVVEAALQDEFCMHGLLCTTMFSSPVIIANGPVVGRIGMNSGLNALGQGNRANATIGRALQLIIRNVGGGRPGEIDRATLGNPGKYSYCFAEAEDIDGWTPLSVQRGCVPGQSAVTLFAGHGLEGVVDQKSRTPESLARTFAVKLKALNHPKLIMAGDAILVVSPEHHRVFAEAGWSKERLSQELDECLMLPADDLIVGVDGIAEGLPAKLAGQTLPKFRPGGLMIVKAGGGAGMFSAIIPGWMAGEIGSIPVTKAFEA